MKTTSEYIYNTLFIKGESSDITIKALGKYYPRSTDLYSYLFIVKKFF